MRFTTRWMVQGRELRHLPRARRLSRMAFANAALAALLLCGAAAPPSTNRPLSSQPPIAHDHATPPGQPSGPILQPPRNVDPGMIVPAPHPPRDSISIPPPRQVNPDGQDRGFH